MDGNYGCMLVLTLALLAFMRVNHSRESARCRIIKWGLYLLLINEVSAAFRAQILFDSGIYPLAVIYLALVIYFLTEAVVTILAFMYLLTLFPALEKKGNALQTLFFTCVSIAALVIVTTPITGFVYHLDYRRDGGPVVLSGSYALLFYVRLVLLAVFFVVVLWKRAVLPRRQFENMSVVLAVSVALHLCALVFRSIYPFGFFANTFFGMLYWLFHSASYEEGRGYMGSDLYGKELAYDLSGKRPFYVFEVSVANIDYLMQRGKLSRDDLMSVYGELFERMNEAYRRALVFRKHPGRIGVIAEGLSQEEAQAMAERLKEWMEGLFDGILVYHIVGISCPQYGECAADVEHLLKLLTAKCEPCGIYFCSEEDFAEFDARGEVLLYLQNICAQEEDMVLFGSPMIDRKSSRIERFEVFGRAQMAGSGIIGSHRITDLARQYGYSHDVNLAVLKNICEYLKTAEAAGTRLKVSLRISSDELENPGFAGDVLDIVNQYGFEKETIGFEIKMAPGQRDIEGMLCAMQTLRENGIIFILADFSPSSVNFEGIAELPFKTVKFASGCVRQAAESTKRFDVTGLLVDMLKDRGYDIVFKGVEDEELDEIALSLGADYLEGEHYARTLPLDDIAQQLDLEAMF